ASTPSETATGSAGRTTKGSQSRQLSASADDQPIVQTSQHPEWFSQPRRPPSPDRDWNKTLPAAQGDAQSWISDLARQTDARSSFNELLDTPIDFFNLIMNRLNVDTLTPELLAETGKGGDEVSESEGESDKEETRQKEEGSFDPIPRTPEGSEEESNDEEDQELRLSEEARIQEEEEADEL
nr:hypothetical protein [Tanacetum cinerariifolium]